jgi:3-deoxy-D-manno-octulosonic-acid transferase
MVLQAYRGAMAMVAGAAGVLGRMPANRWQGVGDRLGRLPAAERAAATSAPALWVHAASVGELQAVRALLPGLRSRWPGRLLVLSTTTRTGLALARELPEAHLAFLLPLDARAAIRPLLRSLRLEGFLFTETEIWPTLLGELHAAGVPALMVSGRVSARNAARARWLRPLYRAALADVTCCMQSEEDARRIVLLGADEHRVHVAGSLKTAALQVERSPAVEAVGRALGVPARAVFVAGSTHEGEEAAALEAYDRALALDARLVLLIAPRHPERFARAAEVIRAAGHTPIRFAALADGSARLPASGPVVVLLDEVGTLAGAYGLGRVAFVGGSLARVGGHNVLEPARAGVPVLVGPHTAHAADTVEALIEAGGALRVESAEALADALCALVADDGRRARMAERGRLAGAVDADVVGRHLRLIGARLATAGAPAQERV